MGEAIQRGEQATRCPLESSASLPVGVSRQGLSTLQPDLRTDPTEVTWWPGYILSGGSRSVSASRLSSQFTAQSTFQPSTSGQELWVMTKEKQGLSNTSCFNEIFFFFYPSLGTVAWKPFGQPGESSERGRGNFGHQPMGIGNVIQHYKNDYLSHFLNKPNLKSTLYC